MKNKKGNPFKNITKYIKEREYFKILLVLLFVMILTNIANLIAPQLISKILDEYVEINIIKNQYIYLMITLVIIGSLTTFFQSFLTKLIGEKIGQDLRNRLTNKILNKDYNYIVKTKPSKLLTVVISDVNYIKNSFIQIIIWALVALLMILGSAYLMFTINSRIATYVVLSVPTIIITLMFLIRKRFELFKKVQKIRDRLNKVITENIKGSMLIRVFVSEKQEENKFEKVNTKSKNLGIEISKIFAIVIPAVNAINLSAFLIIIYFGGQEAISGNLTIGQISALNSYVILFTMPILMLGFMFTMLGQSMASLSRINEVLDSPDEFEDGKKNIKTIENISVKNLSIDIDEKKVLKKIDFEINKGEKIGLIGLTGSGKSLFLKTLVRSLEPSKGTILVNNENVKDYEIKKLRKLIGFSFQENFLVKGNILENIIFGRNISKEDALKAAKIAEVEEFANIFEDKYNHDVGERGTKLSGGQKQRIMIARALASNPDLLILDDATSRLDISTEKKVFENIKKEYKDISIILVAQKISSIQDCDRIYIFENGEIEDFGTHEKLKETSLLYKEIELTQKNYGN